MRLRALLLTVLALAVAEVLIATKASAQSTVRSLRLMLPRSTLRSSARTTVTARFVF